MRAHQFQGFFLGETNAPEHSVFVGASFGLVIVIGAWLIYSVIHRPYERLVKQYEQGQFAVVEGPVRVIYSQPAIRGKPFYDLIEVNNIRFEISSYGSGPGYRQPLGEGGILREGSYVRLSYIQVVSSIHVRYDGFKRIDTHHRAADRAGRTSAAA